MTPGPPPLVHVSSPVNDKARPGPAARIQRFGGEGSFAVDAAQIGMTRDGKPLPQALLAKMEAALGADFSAVRVHVGPQAARIGALAFTTGNDLYFAPGQYQPDNVRGQQLIGHELAHVIQQRQGRVRAPGSGMFVVNDRALEAEADRLGMKAATYRSVVQPKFLQSPTAGHTQPRPARPAVQKKWAPFGGRIQRSRASTRDKKVSSSAMDPIVSEVSQFWARRTSAGTKNANLVFAAQGGHSCSARGTANGTAYTGEFDSDGMHAEMDLITNIYAGENSLAGITSIEIEKEPCPRCAVVLRSLGLSGFVQYKNSGQKDYPTWRTPNLGTVSWEEMLGIADSDYPEEVVTHLTKYFATNKFW
jgi:hypothetical protein